MLRRTVGYILRLQLGLTVASLTIWGLLAGPRVATAAAVGGGISLLLTLYAGARVLARPAGESPRTTYGVMMRAEVMKLLLTALLVSVAVIVLHEGHVALVTTLAATLAAYWVALLRAGD